MTSLEQFSTPGQLTLFVDIIDPYSHLALPGTLQLLRQTKYQAKWYPFSRPPLRPPAQQTATEDRSAAHRRRRAEYRERELRFYAQALELPIQRLYADVDTRPFAHALLWVTLSAIEPERVSAFVAACFAGHWSGSLAIDNCREVARQLDDCGVRGKSWLTAATQAQRLTAAAQAEVTAHLGAAEATGLFNTPAYLVQGEVFYGRAHLPLLRERLLATNA